MSQEPLALTAEAIFLGVVLAAFLGAVFSRFLRMDVAAVLLMVALMFPWIPLEEGGMRGVLTVPHGLSGFGSPALVMVVGMFVLSAGMERTGAAGMLGNRLLAASAGSERLFQLTILGAVTLFSAFVSDTTSVLVWMPLVLAVCRERGHSPSRVLMVIAIASLLGGQWTLIGTRSNVLVSDFLRSRTGEGLHFLSFTPIAVAIWAAFTLFFVTIGRRLLPTRGDEQSLADRYEVKEYLTEVLIAPTAELAGKRLEDLDLPGEGVTILGVVRGERHLPPSPWIEIHSGDVLIVQGLISGITSLLARPGFEERTELKLRDQTLRSVDLRMVEAVVAPNSGLEGHSLDELDFHDRYRLSVLGIGRGGRPLAGRPTAQELRFGDSLLLVGHEEMIRRLRGDESLILMESRALPARSRRRAVFLLVVFAAVVVLASTRVLEPALALVVGAMAAVLGRCIGMREAYQAVDWRTIVVLGSMIPYGLALEETGTAELLARGTVRLLGDHGPHAIFAALLLLVVLATQVIENAAVAVILAPVAYELARAAGADPVPYLLGTAICTSAGFTNPMAHESTLLVFAPGGYRFRDYLVLGIPAALITWVVSVLLVPLLHPLTP